MSSERELEANKTLSTETCRNHSDESLNSYHKHDCDTLEGRAANGASKVYKATKGHNSLKQMFKKFKISKSKHKTSSTCEAESEHKTSATCEASTCEAESKHKTSTTYETSACEADSEHKAGATCEAAEERSRDTAAEVPSYPVYIAKYRYQPRTNSDLGFGKRDLLYIVNTDDKDWWLARVKDTGQEGYIPSSYVVNTESSIEVEK